MNFFQLIYAYIKKNLKTAQETEDSDERKKQWIKIVFGIVLALGYGGLHVPPNVSVSEVIYALGILFITLYVCLLYTSPSPRDCKTSRMPSSA